MRKDPVTRQAAYRIFTESGTHIATVDETEKDSSVEFWSKHYNCQCYAVPSENKPQRW